MEMRRLLSYILFVWLIGVSNGYALPVKGSVIKGKVTDLNGYALSGAGVTLENTYLGVHTDTDGNFTIAGLNDGVYMLRVTYIGYETYIQEVKLYRAAVLLSLIHISEP